MRRLRALLCAELGAGSRSVIVGSMIGASILIGSYAVVQGGAPAGTAHLWVENGAGTCERSATFVDYAGSASPDARCGTFDEAYDKSNCGDVVYVMDNGGTFGEQTLTETAAGTACGDGNKITIQEASGEDVFVECVMLGSATPSCEGGAYSSNATDNVVLRGFATDGVSAHGDAINVVLDQIDGGSVFVSGVQNFTVSNSDIGPCSNLAQTCHGLTDDQPPNRIEGCNVPTGAGNPCPTITDGVYWLDNVIHDFTMDQSPDPHWECFWINGGANVVFRGNKFYNCTTTAMSLGEHGNGNPCPDQCERVTGTWYIENNWIGTSATEPALNFGQFPYFGTIIVRFNSGGGTYNEGGTLGCQVCPDDTGTVIVVGNVWGNGTDWCVPGATMNRNVWVADYGGNNGRCPSTAESNGTLLNTYPYVNSSGGSAMDYHLTGSNVSGLDNFVETSVGSSDLATDWDGQARPIDTALGTDCTGSGSTACRDAGADER